MSENIIALIKATKERKKFWRSTKMWQKRETLRETTAGEIIHTSFFCKTSNETTIYISWTFKSCTQRILTENFISRTSDFKTVQWFVFWSHTAYASSFNALDLHASNEDLNLNPMTFSTIFLSQSCLTIMKMYTYFPLSLTKTIKDKSWPFSSLS